MTFLPIVDRELRIAARRPVTYWSRLASVATSLAIVAVMLYSAMALSTRMLGYEIFQSIFFVNFTYCLMCGLHTTADCISSEKREGTLGFLFLTDLKGVDVILGKLVVTSLKSFYGLIAILPVLVIPMLLGGVAAAEIARAGLLLVLTMLFSLTAGILVSVLNHDARKSGAWTFILIMGIAAGCPALGGWLSSYYRNAVPGVFSPLFLVSPGFAAVAVMDRMGGMRTGFWWSASLVALWSVIFLWLASRIIVRNWQDKPATKRRARWREIWRELVHGRPLTRATYRRKLLDINAMFWLASRNRLKAYYLWLFLGTMALLWCWGFHTMGRDWLGVQISLTAASIFHLVIKMGVATDAGERFGQDCRNGALELILSTRTRVEDLLQGQLLALRRHFARAVLVILIVDLLFLATVPFANGRGNDFWDVVAMAVTLAATMVMFLLDLRALAWVGMWMGLATPDLKKASGETIGRVLMLPWGGMLLVNATFSLLTWWLQIRAEIPYLVELGMWFTFSVVTDVYFTRWAQHKLRTEFRTMAMRRYLPERPPGLWGVLGEFAGRWWGKAMRLLKTS